MRKKPRTGTLGLVKGKEGKKDFNEYFTVDSRTATQTECWTVFSEHKIPVRIMKKMNYLHRGKESPPLWGEDNIESTITMSINGGLEKGNRRSSNNGTGRERAEHFMNLKERKVCSPINHDDRAELRCSVCWWLSIFWLSGVVLFAEKRGGGAISEEIQTRLNEHNRGRKRRNKKKHPAWVSGGTDKDPHGVQGKGKVSTLAMEAPSRRLAHNGLQCEVRGGVMKPLGGGCKYTAHAAVDTCLEKRVAFVS